MGKPVRPSHPRRQSDSPDAATAEEIRAGLRHGIPILTRRSHCFARKLETLRAVMEVFIDAYHRFGVAKHEYRQRQDKGGLPFAFVDFI